MQIELVICTGCKRLCLSPKDWYMTHRYGGKVMGRPYYNKGDCKYTRLFTYETWKEVLNKNV